MNRYARPENFGHHIRTPLLRKHFVYRTFDSAGRLLYVGCTSNIDMRMAEHKSCADWYADMARMAIAGPFNYETARQMEYDAIEVERSLHNHSTERRALRRLSHLLFDQHTTRLVEAGMDYETASTFALRFVDANFPEGKGRGPVAIDDTTLPRARRFVADHARGGAA